MTIALNFKKGISMLKVSLEEEFLGDEPMPGEASEENRPSRAMHIYKKWIPHDRFFYLLINLLFVAIIFPSIDHLDDGDEILALFFSLFLFSTFYIVKPDDKRAWLIHFVTLPSCLIGCALLLLPNEIPHILTLPQMLVCRILFHSAFFLSLMWYLLPELWGESTQGADKIIGGCSLYLLIGLFWAYQYGLIAVFRPDAFAVSQPQLMDYFTAADNSTHYHPRSSVFIYFSFVTLTTVGFGDVTPVSSSARTLVWLEAVVGQFLVTFILARLVSMYLEYHKEKGKEKMAA